MVTNTCTSQIHALINPTTSLFMVVICFAQNMWKIYVGGFYVFLVYFLWEKMQDDENGHRYFNFLNQPGFDNCKNLSLWPVQENIQLAFARKHSIDTCKKIPLWQLQENISLTIARKYLFKNCKNIFIWPLQENISWLEGWGASAACVYSEASSKYLSSQFIHLDLSNILFSFYIDTCKNKLASSKLR